MEKKKIQNDYSIEKLNKSIQNINVVSQKLIKNKNSNADEEVKLKKNVNYLKLFSKNVLKEDDNQQISYLENMLKLSKEALQSTGDEYLEILWEMYDTSNFYIHNLDYSLSYYDYFLHLFFLNNKNLDNLLKKQIITIDKERKKIVSSLDTSNSNFNYAEFYENQLETGNDSEILKEKKNFLIDLNILQIFCFSQMNLFYTSLSSFIINTESSVMLLYKTISLFAICLWNIEKKENFVGSLIFVIGGVLRDHARSYLKTKGILNENLSYHLCSNQVRRFKYNYRTTNIHITLLRKY